MTSAKASQNNEWFQSSQYWDQWFQAQRGQWSEFFREWQNGVSPKQASPLGADAYQKFFTQAGQQFVDMMQQFSRSAGQDKSPADATREWTEGLKEFFTGQTQPEAYKAFATMNENMMKAGAAWMASFQNTGAKPQAGFGQFDPFGFYASMPGIGYTREKQEEWNELYRRWAEYERMSQRYNAAMAKVGLEAVRRFQQFLANPPKDKEPLKSLKEIYAKWVDVCEEVYAQFAVTKEYTQVYGQSVNALMAFKKQWNSITDDMAEQLNVPTRREVDSLHERLHALRRENLALRKDVEELKKAAGMKPAPAKKPAARKGKKS